MLHLSVPPLPTSRCWPSPEISRSFCPSQGPYSLLPFSGFKCPPRSGQFKGRVLHSAPCKCLELFQVPRLQPFRPVSDIPPAVFFPEKQNVPHGVPRPDFPGGNFMRCPHTTERETQKRLLFFHGRNGSRMLNDSKAWRRVTD